MQISNIQSEMDRLRLFLDRRYGMDFCLGGACPNDVVAFLIMKERDGRTQVHDPLCPRGRTAKRGQRINPLCDRTACEVRTHFNSVHTTISLLRSGFDRAGIVGVWSDTGRSGNPARSFAVGDHAKAVEKEQARASVESTQALPIPDAAFYELLNFLSRPFDGNVWNWVIQNQTIFLFMLAHGLARRPDDLGVLRSVAFEWAPDKESMLVSMHDGKTNAGRRVDRVLVRPNPDKFKCVIAQALRYRNAIRMAGINMRDNNYSIFFMIDRRCNPPRADLTQATDASLWTARLQAALKEMGAFNGQTLYGFRVMSSLVAKWDPEEWSTTRAAGGWDSVAAAKLYSRFSLLAAAVANPRCTQTEVAAWLAQRGEWSVFI